MNQDFDFAPTVTASAYAAGDAVGTIQSLPAAKIASKRGLKIQTLVARFKPNATASPRPDLQFWFFKGNPSGSTFTDKSTFTVVAADADKVLGIVEISSSDWATINTSNPSIVAKGGIEIDVQLWEPDGTPNDLYIACVAKSAFTPASTSDFSYTLDIGNK